MDSDLPNGTIKGSIIDATVYVSPSRKFIEIIESLSYNESMPISIKNIMKKKDKKSYSDCRKENNVMEDEEDLNKDNDINEQLTITDLKWLLNYLEKNSNDDYNIYIHELLVDSKIELPANEKIERNPELEERCIRLRKDQMNRKYRAMTKNVDNVRAKQPEETIAYQIKHLNKQLVAVLQFVMSVAAGFMFGFLGVELIFGGLDFGFRLLLGVMCSLIIALAEIYFLAKKLNEDLTIGETVQLGGPPVYPKKNN